jgi:hypothetical protein
LFSVAAAWAGAYQYEVVAWTNSSLMGFHSEVSINDSNRVAFIGQETSDYTFYTGVWYGDGGGNPPVEVCPGCGESFVAYDDPQINNDGIIACDYRASGLPPYYAILAVNPATENVVTVDQTYTVGYWSTSVQLPSISPNIPSAAGTACVVYDQIDPTVTPTAFNLRASYSPLGSGNDQNIATSTSWYTDRPRIANGGLVVARAGDNTTDPITLYETGAGTTTVIGGPPDFSAVGEAPGISDDGSVVVFYGENAEGPGIFASVYNDTDDQTLITVVSGLTNFYSDSPIGVTSPQGDPKSFTVVYYGALGRDGGISSSVVHFPADDEDEFVVDDPVTVVAVGDTISDGTNSLEGVVQDLEIYDPVNNQGTIAFWVETDTGNQGIVRATLSESETPDLVAVSLDWATDADECGLQFAFSLEGSSLPNATEAALFWASGTSFADIITQTPIYVEPIPEDFAVGTTQEVCVACSYLTNPPNGATYILLVLDPDNTIMETDKENNILDVPYDSPAITVQPVSRTVIQGSDVVFTVKATGTEPLSYQWQFNGEDLEDSADHVAGAMTDTLTISEVQADDAGSYSVVVSSECWNTNSQVATLTVAGLCDMIPDSECSALTDLYNATAGKDWEDNSDWLDLGSADWFGVMVSDPQFDENGNFILHSCNVLDISLPENNLVGTIPSTVANLTKLEKLDLSGNELQGSIPGFAFTFLNHLETLDLSTNELSGAIPTGLGNLSLNLTALNFSANKLSGSLPPDLANMALLELLDLSDNSLSGTISLGAMSQLETLDLSRNAFGGTLTNVVLAPKLQFLDLSDNKIVGPIPVSSGWFLSLCAGTLQRLNLSDNDLSGPLPDMGAYNQLQELDFSGNDLTGGISSDYNELGVLQKLDLSQNNLTGSIPDLGNLSMLQELSLSSNDLSGAIPATLGTLHQLENLDLSSNHFTGILFEFPSTLRSLDIRSNDLDFTSATIGVENSNYVRAMQAEDINVKWMKQNPPSLKGKIPPKTDPNGGTDPFTVVVDGAPPLYFQWQFDGINLTDNSHISGSQTATLSFNVVEFADAGSYQVIVTNAYGSITSAPVMLTVTSNGIVPSITNQPINLSVVMGGSAAFSVSATGSSPLAYQWLLNGADLPGATTATLAIASASLTNAGSYTVVVTNSFGAVTNLAGTLSVTTVPLLFATNGAGIQVANGMVMLQISGLTAAGPVVVQVSSDLIQWTSIATNSTDSGTIQVIDTAPTNSVQRYYRVVESP